MIHKTYSMRTLHSNFWDMSYFCTQNNDKLIRTHQKETPNIIATTQQNITNNTTKQNTDQLNPIYIQQPTKKIFLPHVHDLLKDASHHGSGC